MKNKGILSMIFRSCRVVVLFFAVTVTALLTFPSQAPGAFKDPPLPLVLPRPLAGETLPDPDRVYRIPFDIPLYLAGWEGNALEFLLDSQEKKRLPMVWPENSLMPSRPRPDVSSKLKDYTIDVYSESDKCYNDSWRLRGFLLKVADTTKSSEKTNALWGSILEDFFAQKPDKFWQNYETRLKGIAAIEKVLLPEQPDRLRYNVEGLFYMPFLEPQREAILDLFEDYHKRLQKNGYIGLEERFLIAYYTQYPMNETANAPGWYFSVWKLLIGPGFITCYTDGELYYEMSKTQESFVPPAVALPAICALRPSQSRMPLPYGAHHVFSNSRVPFEQSLIKRGFQSERHSIPDSIPGDLKLKFSKKDRDFNIILHYLLAWKVKFPLTWMPSIFSIKMEATDDQFDYAQWLDLAKIRHLVLTQKGNSVKKEIRAFGAIGIQKSSQINRVSRHNLNPLQKALEEIFSAGALPMDDEAQNAILDAFANCYIDIDKGTEWPEKELVLFVTMPEDPSHKAPYPSVQIWKVLVLPNMIFCYTDGLFYYRGASLEAVQKERYR